MLTIEQVQTSEEVDIVRCLFREYEEWLGLDLCFQGFEEELRLLPGKYQKPEGRLLLATSDGQAAGCVAMRKLDVGIAEMKRLFVRPDFRGSGIGLRLVEMLIDEAREAGYSTLRLDTHPPKMGKAVSLYEAYGFRPIPAYYNNPHKDVLFMELDLTAA